MTTKVNSNGPVRRTLASQLDRLDQILDGLCENLNWTVADAVRGTVGTTVREALQAVQTEVLTNPAPLVQLQPPAPTPSHDPSPPTSWLGRLRAAGDALGEGIRRAATWACRQAGRRLTTVLLAGAGVATPVAAVLFRPKLALLAGWVAGNVTALAARLGLRLLTASPVVT